LNIESLGEGNGIGSPDSSKSKFGPIAMPDHPIKFDFQWVRGVF